MWGNVAEAPGKPFTRSGHRLATVLYIHYLSKVPTSHLILAFALVMCVGIILRHNLLTNVAFSSDGLQHLMLHRKCNAQAALSVKVLTTNVSASSPLDEML